MIELLKESGLFLALTTLPVTILANIMLGAAMSKVDVKGHFNWDKMKRGLLKGVFIYIGILSFTIVSYLMNDLTIEILGGEYSLTDAMYIIILGTIIRYSVDGMNKLIEIMRYKEEDIDGKD